MIVPVILSGGAGTRLWPLSRELYPKQLLPLCSEQTMLQETYGRLQGLPALGSPLIVCNEHHRFMVAEQLRLVNDSQGGIILEPVGRNTAPAVAVAAFEALRKRKDPLLLVLPADHVIQDPAVLRQTVEKMVPYAEQGHLLTFGIVPDQPETGYGYIRRGEGVGDANSEPGPYRVAQFVEKPDQDTAQTYLASGDYLWNSGMFLFKASVYLEELEKFAPQMVAACRAAWQSAQTDLDFLRLGREEFAACPSDSIDYAVIKRQKRLWLHLSMPVGVMSVHGRPCGLSETKMIRVTSVKVTSLHSTVTTVIYMPIPDWLPRSACRTMLLLRLVMLFLLQPKIRSSMLRKSLPSSKLRRGAKPCCIVASIDLGGHTSVLTRLNDFRSSELRSNLVLLFPYRSTTIVLNIGLSSKVPL